MIRDRRAHLAMMQRQADRAGNLLLIAAVIMAASVTAILAAAASVTLIRLVLS